MEYITFKLDSKVCAIKVDDKYALKPTQINKLTPIKNPRSKFLSGVINYKKQIVDVWDISSYLLKEPLKKFDGIMFVSNSNVFGFKFNGFFQIINAEELHDVNLVNLDKICKRFKV